MNKYSKTINFRRETRKIKRGVFGVWGEAGWIIARSYYKQRLNKKIKYIKKNLKNIKSYFPRLSYKMISGVVMLAMVITQVFSVGAFEAHVINVTAKFVNDTVDINIEGGYFCDDESEEIELSSTLAGADIIYTLFGEEPECGAVGYEYTGPFSITQSVTIKAVTCHDNKQSAVHSWDFEFSPEYCDECVPEIGDFCTQTIGGWGQACHGNNAGCMRDNNWDNIINGNLDVGGNYKMTFTGAAGIENYLPDGGPSASLAQNYINPLSTESGVMGSQITALKLNVLFSDAHVGLITPGSNISIGELVIATGTFANINVYSFLELAEAVLGGDLTRLVPFGAGYSDITETAAMINENFVDCAIDNGYLLLPECVENYCGNGILEDDEECDDGNNVNGDGCSAVCTTEECVPEDEICDNIDNDCDGIVDNVYAWFNASSTAFEARLDNGTVVTEKTEKSDNKYAYQSVDSTRFIYLDWQFDNIYPDVEIGSTTLWLEHQEHHTTTTVEWWDGSDWVEVCDPDESEYINGGPDEDIVSKCDLSAYLDTPSKVSVINLRLRLERIGNCYEKLDYAFLEFNYRSRVYCEAECGNWRLEEGEECDDGNTADNDGCNNLCEIEEADACMKINEVYYDPDCEHGGYKNEWIELYNNCDYTVNLKDWSLKDNNSEEIFKQNNLIDAKQFVVIAAKASVWDYWPLIPENAVKITLGGCKLFDGLGNNGDRVFLYDNYSREIDAVSWGCDTSAFIPAVPDVARGHSISRAEMGVDTDTAADWIDTYSGSLPPGPNPGTNPHDENGNLLTIYGLSSFLAGEPETGETASTTPAVASTTPETASTTPAVASTTPEIASTTPETASTTPDNNNAPTLSDMGEAVSSSEERSSFGPKKTTDDNFGQEDTGDIKTASSPDEFVGLGAAPAREEPAQEPAIEPDEPQLEPETIDKPEPVIEPALEPQPDGGSEEPADETPDG